MTGIIGGVVNTVGSLLGGGNHGGSHNVGQGGQAPQAAQATQPGQPTPESRINDQIQDLRGQQQAVMQAKASGQISDTQYQQQIGDLEKRIADLEKSKAPTETGTSTAAPPAPVAQGFSGQSTFEPAPAKPPVEINPSFVEQSDPTKLFLENSGGGSKPGASGGSGATARL